MEIMSAVLVGIIVGLLIALCVCASRRKEPEQQRTGYGVYVFDEHGDEVTHATRSE